VFQLIEKQPLEETHEVLLTVEFEPQAVSTVREKTLKRLAREVRLPGFRPGRIPENVLVRRFGEAYIQEAMVDDLLDESYITILEKAEVTPYSQAQTDVSLLSTDPFRVQLRIELSPVVEVGDYQSLRVPYPEVSVTEEEIQEELEELRRRMAQIEPVERPAERGDALVIEHLEIRDGDEVLYHNHDVRLLLDEETSGLPASVIEAMVGMSAGDSKEFKVVIPEGDTSSFANLAGHELDFEVVVSQVNSYTLPELDDAFASTLGPFTSLDEVRRVIEHQLFDHKSEEVDRAYQNAVLDALMPLCQVKIPPTMLAQLEKDRLESVREQLRKQGTSLEQVLRAQGMTLEQYLEEQRPALREDLARMLVLRKIYDQENLAEEEDWDWEPITDEEELEVEAAEVTEDEALAEAEEATTEGEEEALAEENWEEDEDWEEEDEEEEEESWYDVAINYLMDIAAQED